MNPVEIDDAEANEKKRVVQNIVFRSSDCHVLSAGELKSDGQYKIARLLRKYCWFLGAVSGAIRTDVIVVANMALSYRVLFPA
jgi:hypothetical protein